MIRQHYLADADVRRFIAWMGQHLHADSRLGHTYARPRLAPLHFANLAAAFELYEWDFSFRRIDGSRCAGRSFAENAAVLDELQGQLRKAQAAGADEAIRDAAIEVVRWGGVAPHNEEWLRAHCDGLAACLAQVRNALARDDDQLDLGPDLRFNAGMTKVYSLLLDHFVIYDSRVAGALAWFVAAWAGEGPVPAVLRFPCMEAKGAPGAARRKLRNPRPGREGFPLLGVRPHVHAKWNLRASWIIRAVLDANPGTVFGSGTAASRRLEAALFMWGYDLTAAAAAPAEAADADRLALRAA